MFGKYKFEAGFVKKNKNNVPVTHTPEGMSREELIRTTKELVREVAIGVVGAVVVVIAANTISEIAVNRYGQPKKELED